MGNAVKLGVKGEGEVAATALAGADGPPCPMLMSPVSNLVIAKPVGTLPDPLAFLFFELGPFDADGEACRERLRGVIVAEVACEGCDEVVRLMGDWNCKLKFRCKLCKSELEWERRNGAILPTGGDISNVASVGKAPAPGKAGTSAPFEVCVDRVGIL
jgi:hypothetical protein